MRPLLLSLCVFALGCAPTVDDDPFGDGNPGDALESGRLGVGVNALASSDRPRVNFKSTASGVVAAALYELHRGEQHTLADILAETTEAHVARGPYAAVETPGVDANGEPEGSNWDPVDAQPIATITVNGRTRQLGPIETYLRVNGIYSPAPWCGSFATYVLRRAGLTVPTMKLARNVPNVLAQLGGPYYRVDGAEVLVDPDHPDDSPVTYTGPLEEGLAGEAQSYRPARLATIRDVDLRAGDVVWLEHADGSGHVGLVAGVARSGDSLQIVTIEGNKDDMLTASSHSLVLVDGKLTADWKGWGRPPALDATPIAVDLDHPAPWILAALATLPQHGRDR